MDGDQTGQLSQAQVMKGPQSETVWTYPEDQSSHPRVLSKGRTDAICFLNTF